MKRAYERHCIPQEYLDFAKKGTAEIRDINNDVFFDYPGARRARKNGGLLLLWT